MLEKLVKLQGLVPEKCTPGCRDIELVENAPDGDGSGLVGLRANHQERILNLNA